MNQVAKRTEPEIMVPANNAMTPMDMLDRAITSGASVEVMEKLMELQERWEKNNARKAFDNAMSNAMAEIPVIVKNREVDFTSQKGRTNYRHEDMAGIARVVDPILAKHGLSYRYNTKTDAGMVTVTCIVSHRDGHSEENSLSAGRDTTGNKNDIQAVGSTITYLQRYSLKAALGLAASDDDDAKAAVQTDAIDEKQLADLVALSDEVKADKVRFCKHFKIERLDDLPTHRLSEATALLEAKRTQK